MACVLGAEGGAEAAVDPVEKAAHSHHLLWDTEAWWGIGSLAGDGGQRVTPIL